MNAMSLALGPERPRERDVSWERKPFTVAWSAEPFYNPERILEKQGMRSPAGIPPGGPIPEEAPQEAPDYPDWLIKGFAVGAILFVVGLLGMAAGAIGRRALFTDVAIAIMAVGMIVLAFAIMKGREITDRAL